MSAWRKSQPNMAFRCCFTGKPLLAGILGLALLVTLLGGVCSAAGNARGARRFPLEMDALMGALSDTRRPTPVTTDSYPRTVPYRFMHYDFATDQQHQEQRSVTLEHQPLRIIPHSTGLTEILWAIVPHERLVAVHKSCKDRQYSFLAPLLPDDLPVYGTDDAEIVIGYRPDLVMTSFFSNANFLHQLRTAHIPMAQFGFFDDLDSIKEQILLAGRLTGEENSARRLVAVMDEKLRDIQTAVRKRRTPAAKPPTVLYYDNMAYVAGAGTTFDSMCKALGVTNIAAVKGIRNFKQIDYETLLQWDPEVIIVPEESTYDRQLYSQPMLATARAVRRKNIRKMPTVYLLSSSQYLVASINYLAGLIYESSF
ncbi:metal ABC transporter, periplasmic substrate-binding protein [Syntrophotalea carbinolica DSM 2380]|uniref:Metal ABC transporter, periplasmic substrate-binding protein n=1 Tax=Syntrophotalea carbinolica (strain DSM 2380 / NBRC 103641 / GraBd1) TaxID=338963 RepID=Q3A7C0_SYNC1|nr:ABC transporter substrate-binding protein [Syntrophotalea carbinolica]ABA87724.2 metal ABC transporter, periplasmic substrate-binding protein [Syntrophotalea carbinolica DSM 2380]